MELRAGGDPLDWMLVAMIQWQLGQRAAAEASYARAETAISKGSPILYLDIGALGFRRLHAEAAELLGQVSGHSAIEQ